MKLFATNWVQKSVAGGILLLGTSIGGFMFQMSEDNDVLVQVLFETEAGELAVGAHFSGQIGEQAIDEVAGRHGDFQTRYLFSKDSVWMSGTVKLGDRIWTLRRQLRGRVTVLRCILPSSDKGEVLCFNSGGDLG